jgi:hypothetical protein
MVETFVCPCCGQSYEVATQERWRGEPLLLLTCRTSECAFQHVTIALESPSDFDTHPTVIAARSGEGF